MADNSEQRKEHPLYALLRARGVPMAPKDHWIYSEGSSTTFLPPTSRKSARKGSTSTTPPGETSTDSQPSKPST